jgi:hypothetical protein
MSLCELSEYRVRNARGLPEEELYSFVGEGWEQEDDITLLTLRCSAP